MILHTLLKESRLQKMYDAYYFKVVLHSNEGQQET
jgi:hypothetical protein